MQHGKPALNGSSSHGFKLLKSNEKVNGSNLISENWRIDNSRVLRWVVSLFEWNSLFCRRSLRFRVRSGSGNGSTSSKLEARVILKAISQLFPFVEHGYCVRQIYNNMKQIYRGRIYKDFLWRYATTTIAAQFEKLMDDLKCFNPKLMYGFKRYHIHLGQGHIFQRVFDEENNVQEVIDMSEGPLTPTTTTIFNAIMKEANDYSVIWNGGDTYQCKGPWKDQCVVNMKFRTCTCRR
ncbi:hypothetical protein Tco_0260602 [Tanacetum coccineum]